MCDIIGYQEELTAMKNLLMTICYDGTGFSGWQRQPAVRTVQGELEGVLSSLCGGDIELFGTSRTDAGVHALGQRATLRGDFAIPEDRLLYAANNLLSGGKGSSGGDIRILQIERKEEGFHARYDALGKTYLYKINNAREPDLFRRNYCYHVGTPLDLNRMRKMADLFTGEHDFRCFMSAGGQEPKTTVRHIRRITIDGASEGDVTIQVVGNSFLYNMVRILTGTLIEAGLGKRDPEEAGSILAGKDRRRSGHTAPPFGLYLYEVYFSEEDLRR